VPVDRAAHATCIELLRSHGRTSIELLRFPCGRAFPTVDLHVDLRRLPHLRERAGVIAKRNMMKRSIGMIGRSLAIGVAACGQGDPTQPDDLAFSISQITFTADANYNLVGVQSGKCVDVAGASSASSASLEIATCDGSTHQQFHIEAQGSGFRMRNLNSNLCADVSGASTADGAKVVQFACGTGQNQEWSFTDLAGGAERITALHSGKALDVTGASGAQGALLQQWPVNNGGNQKFRLQAVGASGTVGTTGAATHSKAFAQNRFHFGTIDSIAKKSGSSTISQIDFFTSGWLLGDSFDHPSVCNDTKPGAVFANQVPILVAYVSASHVKRADNTVCDCNVTSGTCVASHDLCHVGAQRIKQSFSTILSAYRSYSQGFAACYGTSRPIIFELEPDWYQYTGSSQSAPFTGTEAGQMLGQIVQALKSALPNALFSIDASPWVAPNNGSDNGKQWYSNFDLSLFSFVNTSGGGTNANTAKIRSSNNMTWAGLSQVTGKPILADTGYGANGAPAGEDPLWNVPANINARMADGVIAISQYSPTSSFGNTVAKARSQLNTPKFNP
jgi:hypothetical protein